MSKITTADADVKALADEYGVPAEWAARYLEAIRKEAMPDDTPRVNRVRLDCGFEAVIIEIEEDAHGWLVSGVGLYLTERGPVVQGTHERHFPKERDARKFANGWYTKYRRKGFRRNPHTDTV
jgi:hypothetical protein